MTRSYNDERDLYVALTCYNYFPNQKEVMGELPPCFSSRQFTPEVCKALSEADNGPSRKKNGFDLAEFRATRYNNVPRTLALVHPKPYSVLVERILSSWEKIRNICDNPNSQVKPEIREDGRVFVMNYENGLSKTSRLNRLSFAKKFMVSADIANCFNSIYSHSIPWALVGLEEAKRNRKPNEWFNAIDSSVRWCKRNETQGIPIGPGTSSIIVELILSEIDSRLSKKGYIFERYVDDYTCYCESDIHAESFIIDLERNLSEFKLSLNLSKTHIQGLPVPNDDEWVLELLGILPQSYQSEEENHTREVISTTAIITFINNALEINRRTPDGSVLKYALQLVIDRVEQHKADIVFQEVMGLAWHYPVLIPFLDRLARNYDVDVSVYEKELNELVKENSAKRRSDGICWPLYLMFTNDLTPSDESVAQVINSMDCLGITMLSHFLGYQESIQGVVNTLLDSDDYTKDNYWILLYQLYYQGDIDNPYREDQTFELLKGFDVNFMPGDSKSEAERKSDQIAIQHIFPDEFEI